MNQTDYSNPKSLNIGTKELIIAANAEKKRMNVEGICLSLVSYSA
jgi:hypothetical protein